MESTDVVVLGAGIVGVSAALHLQARGREVALIDRAGAAGQETSFGNAGLIERSSLIPYLFPRDPARLVKYALNLLAGGALSFLGLAGGFAMAPALLARQRARAGERNIAARRPLIENSLSEHEALIQQAGAGELLRRNGWIKLHRSERNSRSRIRRRGAAACLWLTYRLARSRPGSRRWSRISRRSPAASIIATRPRSSIPPRSRKPTPICSFHAAASCSQETRAAFRKSSDGRWRMTTAAGPLVAGAAVVALGPWSDAIYGPLGYRIPLGWKRGYHMHYAAKDGARLNHPILDADFGYLLAPMRRGVRLTSGAEFARRDAPPTPVQIEVCEPTVRADCFRSPNGSTRNRGAARGPACRTCCRSSVRRRVIAACGSISAMRIMG